MFWHYSPCCDFMDFPNEYTTNVYTIPIENIGKGNSVAMNYSGFL